MPIPRKYRYKAPSGKTRVTMEMPLDAAQRLRDAWLDPVKRKELEAMGIEWVAEPRPGAASKLL